MKQRMSSEFIYQLFALLIAVIVVHAVYVGAIRPAADAQIRQEMALQASGEDYVPQRSFVVVIRDFEQEACFILLIWALAIMGYKGKRALDEQSLVGRRLLDVPEGTSVLPQDAREYSRSLEALPEKEQDYLLPRTLLSALQRFATTGSIQAVSDTIKESCEMWRRIGWTRSCPWCATSPGPYPRSGSSAPCAVSAKPLGRPTRRLKAIFPG